MQGLIRAIIVVAKNHTAFVFVARLLHLPRGFYTCRVDFTLAARLLHLPHGFYTCRVAIALTERILHLQRGFCTYCTDFALFHAALYLPRGFFNVAAGHPSQPVFGLKRWVSWQPKFRPPKRISCFPIYFVG